MVIYWKSFINEYQNYTRTSMFYTDSGIFFTGSNIILILVFETIFPIREKSGTQKVNLFQRKEIKLSFKKLSTSITKNVSQTTIKIILEPVKNIRQTV